VKRVLNGRPVVAGSAKGIAVVSTQPISLWGGLDPQSGKIIDKRHERCGEVITGKVFVFPGGKGSSTASAVLLESIRVGTAPAAIINTHVDPILALGAIVAEVLYQQSIPIVVLSQKDSGTIKESNRLTIAMDGTMTVNRSQPVCTEKSPE